MQERKQERLRLSTTYRRKIANGFCLVRDILAGLWYVWRRYHACRAWLKRLDFGPHNELFTQNTHQRLAQYIFALAWIEYLFVVLTGTSLSQAQRRATHYLSVLTPWFDDLADDEFYTAAEIEQICQLKPQRGTAKEQCCIALFREAGFEWNTYWADVARAQVNSTQQSSAKTRLKTKELLQITMEKGSSSVLLGWHLIGKELGGAPVRAAAERFGAFAQLLNDVFDVRKDLLANVQTLLTNTDSMEQEQARYADWSRQLLHSIAVIEPASRRTLRLQVLCLPLIALGDIAVGQLARIARQKGATLHWPDWSRQELVCDMGWWRNRIAWAWRVWRML